MYSNIYIICELYTCWGSVYKSHDNKQLALVMLCRKWRTNPWRTNLIKAEESMAYESMVDEFKPKESKGDEPWRMAYIVYEILKYWEKRNRCNIYGGEIAEKKKHVEDLGHDVQHGYNI